MKPGLRKRFFAWMLKKSDKINHQVYGQYKRKLFQDISGSVVEIGPGTGVNFDYLPKNIQWLGIEPNEAFHKILLEQARHREINAKIIPGDASQTGLPDNSSDVLICTLVLCSVKDPIATVLELKRVLRPGGKFIFIEHVASQKKTTLRFFQNLFNPCNRFMADGCNCNRETWNVIGNAGFADVKLTYENMKGTMKLHSPHIMGYAIK